MFKAVSFLVFNSDLRTQAALTEIDKSLFLVFVFKFVNIENALSESAFECGSDLIAFTNNLKFGYLKIL